MAEIARGARKTALLAATFALDKKAEEVLVLEVGEVSNVADYLLICSAHSDTQVRAVAEAVRRGLSKEGVKAHHTEGAAHANWVLSDFVDVVVHVMQPGVRRYYHLEGLWADCPQKLYEESAKPLNDLEGEWLAP